MTNKILRPRGVISVATLSAVAASVIMIAIGCSGNADSTVDAFHPTAAFVESVRDRILKVAEEDLRRLNAADIVYKDQIEYQIDPDPINPARLGLGTFVKYYRNLTGYSILDIRRSESLLRPIRIDIQFDFEVVATPSWDIEREDKFLGIDPKRSAERETTFSVVRRCKMVRSYPCDLHGAYDGSLPTAIPRDYYFGERTDIGGQRFQAEELTPIPAGVLTGAPAQSQIQPGQPVDLFSN